MKLNQSSLSKMVKFRLLLSCCHGCPGAPQLQGARVPQVAAAAASRRTSHCGVQASRRRPSVSQAGVQMHRGFRALAPMVREPSRGGVEAPLG
jgi:hypothetical protein